MRNKKVVIYLGNMLSSSGKNPTAVEKLSPLLAEFCDVIAVSKAVNKIARAHSFVSCIIHNHRKAHVAIIDTYSGNAFGFAFLASIFCKLFRIPYVLALHGGELPRFHKTQAKLVSYAFNGAHQLVAPSEYLRRYFFNVGFQHIITIPNALQIEHFPYQEKNDFQCRILWMRAYHEIYNPLLAVKLVKALVDKQFLCHLTMVGPILDDSYEQVSELIKAYELTDYITVKNKISQPEWVKLSGQHDIFLNTSNKDNLPYTLLEAMALGMPVVSTNVGGLPYLLNNGVNGLLTEPNDLVQMEKHIIALCEQPELRKVLSIEGRKTAINYSWQEIKPKWHDLIQSF